MKHGGPSKPKGKKEKIPKAVKLLRKRKKRGEFKKGDLRRKPKPKGLFGLIFGGRGNDSGGCGSSCGGGCGGGD